MEYGRMNVITLRHTHSFVRVGSGMNSSFGSQMTWCFNPAFHIH